jgi:para-nitrobenzyl esterase
VRTFSNPNRREFVTATALAVTAPALLRIGTAKGAELITVEIENGKLQGMSENGAVSFKGIPYAADTGGRNRFMAPRSVANWTGVRDALQLGDRCPQAEGNDSRNWFAWYRQESGFSENCCVLNVFTPDLDSNARRPVMFYVHGGGFRSGGGGGAGLDGGNLARAGDVVVVTINHRLNVLGYAHLAHLDPAFADASNVGQLDIIAALRWVKNNIHIFGGDPGRVTIFGQSGGGSKITTLLAMPGAKGLFHRAINMSGASAFSLVPAAQTEPLINQFLKELGIDKANLRKLQEIPPNQLLAAHRKAVATLRSDDFRPVIDGHHIPNGPLTPEGLAVHGSVPLMVGTTETEASFWLGADLRNVTVTAEQLKARIKSQFGFSDAKTEAIMAAYRKDKPDRTPYEILAAVATDALVRGRMLRGIETRTKASQAPVYLYNFAWKMPVEGGIWLSPHTSDIPFAFANVDKARMMTEAGPGPEEVSRNLMVAFVAFAETGDPSNPRTLEWKPYDTATRATMVVDEKCQLVNDFRGGDRLASAELLGQEIYELQRGPLFRYSE